MRTKLISLLLAASIAATAPLAPAQAGGFDKDAHRTAAALAFGLATLAIIAKAAENQRDKDDRDKPRHAPRVHDPKAKAHKPPPKPVARQAHPPVIKREAHALPRLYPRHETRHHDAGRGNNGHKTWHAHPRRTVKVPASCARRVVGAKGPKTVFGAPCLRRAGVQTSRLPERCARRADAGHRDIRVWGAHCLARNGVRID